MALPVIVSVPVTANVPDGNDGPMLTPLAAVNVPERFAARVSDTLPNALRTSINNVVLSSVVAAVAVAHRYSKLPDIVVRDTESPLVPMIV